ncbi:ABC transporter permease [Streptomyces sp. NPDC059224]|uniref:ABC transporter permease n=1 Tax=Streptomyces sp. NPDC059224 TaxID=3346775 RepID=UPI0036A86121
MSTRPTAPRRALRFAGLFLSRYWTVLALLAAWETWTRVQHLNQIVVPTPYAVFAYVLGDFGDYAPGLGHTLFHAATGLVLGMALGLCCAVAVWFSSLLSGLLTPLLLIMRSVPVIVMIPVIARVVGFGAPAVATVTTLVSFFPAFVLVASGLRTAPAAMNNVFTVFGASRSVRLRRLLLPHTVPMLLVALRLTAPSTVLAALLAEFLLGQDGLGSLFADAVTFMAPERAWGAALVATVVSVAGFMAARGVERRYTPRFR